jgi:O-acetyl-ADP-ribose deacetylase (regulator of RNase III)
MKEILDCIIVKKGDITGERCDAIVNAAAPPLLGGGGVDGAIHRAAGPGLLEECRKLGGCRHGEARITGAYNLPAKFVIHTPGPVYKEGGSNEAEILKSSYYNSLLLAKKENLASIAFPAISTGVYGYPKEEAAEIAVNTIISFMKNEEYILKVIFILFDEESMRIYNKIIEGKYNELS